MRFSARLGSAFKYRPEILRARNSVKRKLLGKERDCSRSNANNATLLQLARNYKQVKLEHATFPPPQRLKTDS